MKDPWSLGLRFFDRLFSLKLAVRLARLRLVSRLLLLLDPVVVVARLLSSVAALCSTDHLGSWAGVRWNWQSSTHDSIGEPDSGEQSCTAR